MTEHLNVLLLSDRELAFLAKTIETVPCVGEDTYTRSHIREEIMFLEGKPSEHNGPSKIIGWNKLSTRWEQLFTWNKSPKAGVQFAEDNAPLAKYARFLAIPL